MNTSLEHLPPLKRDDLRRITDIIVQKIQPEKVILFGSYARGNWVEDRYSEGLITYEYISDYDILVITQQGERRKDYEVQDIVVNTFRPRTPINIIANDIDFVNKDLERNRYFFSDIKKEGIMLYDAGNIPLSDPRELSAAEKKQMAQDDFDHWHGNGTDLLRSAKRNFEEGANKLALFELHQSAEAIYNAVMLVFTGYKPKTHNIEMLYHYNKNHSKELAMVFPQNTPEEKHYFDQLKRGYIDARYSKDFVVTKEELEVLIDRITRLHAIAEAICQKKISAMDVPGV